MTNFEQIKAMTVEEVAKIFGTLFCQASLTHIECQKNENCTECMRNWLNAEAKGGVDNG